MSDLSEYFDLLPTCKIKSTKHQILKPEDESSLNKVDKSNLTHTRDNQQEKADTINKGDLKDMTNMPPQEKCVIYGNASQDIVSAWGIIGRMGNRYLGMDMQYPKSMAIFGDMGSGKSYLCGVLTEMMTQSIPQISCFPREPSAVVIFNYRKVHGARFEYASYLHENDKGVDIEALKNIYNAKPINIISDDFLICAHKSMIREQRDNDYAGLNVSPLLLNPNNLNDDDWQLLLGLPSTDNLYVAVMRNILERLSEENRLTLANLKSEISSHNRLRTNQKDLAFMRIEDLAEKYLSESEGINWEEIIKPGQITILDFRKKFLQAEDALRLALISLRGIGGVSRDIHKFILFDEFHEYYDEKFSDDLDKYRRMVRHNNISFCIATQNTEKVDSKILKSFNNKFIFKIDYSTWEKLCSVDPMLTKREEGGIEYSQVANLHKESGECFMKFDDCTEKALRRQTRKVEIRPRVTKHGGSTAESR